MIDNSVTTAVVLDTRRIKKSGNYPAKLRITFQRRQKYYSTKIDLTKEEYQKVFSERPREPYKSIRKKIREIELKAEKIIEEITPFSFQQFEERFLSHKSTVDIFTLFDEKLESLKKGSINTYESYKSAKKTIQTFSPNLKFQSITVEFLKEYKDWMIETDRSQTTTAIYLRNFRHIVNNAISKGFIKEKDYPFGKKKFEIKGGSNIKKALSNNELSLLLNYSPEQETPEHRYYDYWVFSYLCNGINIKDLALLKWENLDCDKISFYRAKTVAKSKDPKLISAFLPKRAMEIIKTWANPKSDIYIFPILEKGVSEKDIHNRIKQAVKQTNKYIGRIGKNLGIEKRLTTYVARHSFGTMVIRQGGSTEFVKELFGHSSVRVTENYLGDFDEETKRSFAEKLTNF